ncbi:hypothetical protein DK389_08770 [Methylobacterium durans]|uniref:Uncharacterized protein n=1 Tax=Methylobacterium durans TaxID=2202825 RepID=A0A2U8W4Q8_9HYPH|nr:hypothetical protein DK389_08770 [Methylobacterium durans]
MDPCCEWHPIHTAPCDGTAVLVFHPAWDMMKVGICFDKSCAWQQPCGDQLQTPKYWTVLPSLPIEEQCDAT